MLLGDKLFDSYLQEYMWKKQHQNIFGSIFFNGYPFISAPDRKCSHRSISSLNEIAKTFATHLKLAMFYFLAFNSGSVLSGYAFRYVRLVGCQYMFCVLGLVCMAHRINCLIPTCKNTCGRNNIFGNVLYWISFYYNTEGKYSHI